MAIAFRDRGDLNGVRTFFAYWTVEGRLNHSEQAWLLRKLKEIDLPEIMDWIKQEGIAEGFVRGRTEGHLETALENARKMRNHGISWDIVTDVTGIKPEDLQVV